MPFLHISTRASGCTSPLAPHARSTPVRPCEMAVFTGARCNRMPTSAYTCVRESRKSHAPSPGVLPTEHQSFFDCYAFPNHTEESPCQIQTCSPPYCSRSTRTNSPWKPPSWSFPIGSRPAARLTSLTTCAAPWTPSTRMKSSSS